MAFRWRSLRSDVRQHFAFLYERQYEQVRAERDGVFSISGCIVFHRDSIWIMTSRHMGEDFVELSFVETRNPLEWFSLHDVVAALGLQWGTAGVHTFAVKAPILERVVPLVEQAVAVDRDAFQRKVIAARNQALSENETVPQRVNLRRSAGS